MLGTNTALSQAVSGGWIAANRAIFYPFSLTEPATVVQLLWFVGATSSGNIDVGVYDSEMRLLVSAGTTAMSATINTVQELNVADTLLPPGKYYLAGVCSSGTGTIFLQNAASDEGSLSGAIMYEQASAIPLPNPATPVLTTATALVMHLFGIQFASAF